MISTASKTARVEPAAFKPAAMKPASTKAAAMESAAAKATETAGEAVGWRQCDGQRQDKCRRNKSCSWKSP